MTSTGGPARSIRGEDGFSLLVVLGVMLVTSLLLTAGFVATTHDIHLSYASTSHTQAYAAAQAGVQEYDYKLQNNPDYWQSCTGPSGEVEGAYYEVEVLPASGATACSSASPFTTAIQSKGELANTFRIEATGCTGSGGLTSCQGPLPTGTQKRSIVATFQVTGFLDYAYFTQYEDEDYSLYGGSQAKCEQYYSVRKAYGEACHKIAFGEEDSVRGPMHTDDAAFICGKVEFGRKGEEPADAVEIHGGPYTEGGCSDNAIFNTANGKYSEGKILTAPESDSSLKLYVESVNKFAGVTHLVLEGTMIKVENDGVTKTISWPENGLIYVENSGLCTPEYKQSGVNAAQVAREVDCGTVYVNGTYSRSLTIAASTNLIINGNLVPTGVTPGNAPTGTATLGLIATQDVRIYHPVEETKYKKGKYGCNSNQYATGGNGGNETITDPEVGGECEPLNTITKKGEDLPACDANNASGDLTSPWIYAAILSTSHSFLVDNLACGEQLGHLNIYGAIAQKFRGIVAISGESGYVKNYNYDERLATDEPPYFLAPLKAGWKVIRETAPKQG